MLGNGQLEKAVLCFCLLLTLCGSLHAQQQGEKRLQRELGAVSSRIEEPSDLSQDNLSHVAASAAQIRGVLAKDEGLLVELKRWVAKEATERGQVVDDSNLTDPAIFERLEQDVVFRSVATRLVRIQTQILRKRKSWCSRSGPDAWSKLSLRKTPNRCDRKEETAPWNGRRAATQIEMRDVLKSSSRTDGKGRLRPVAPYRIPKLAPVHYSSKPCRASSKRKDFPNLQA